MNSLSLSQSLPNRILELQDPWTFISHCVFTRDEVDVNTPVKPAPIHLGYLQTISDLWCESNKLIVDKSRRMWISWLFLVLHLHLAFTNTNRRVGIVSKKFEDACAHLKNMEFVWENIPEDVYPRALRPKMRSKEGFLFFDEIDSVVHALASGPDQARQYGFSALFFDEFDFWDEQESTYAAAKPTLAGGGKLTIVTTHKPQSLGVDSFYKTLLEDNLASA